MDSCVSGEILWTRFKKEGGQKEFRQLFDRFYAPLCRYAFLMLKDRMEAEEVVLDMFIYLWKNREWVDIDISVERYLFRSVRNRSLNFLRTRHEKGELIDESMEISVPPGLSCVEMDDISGLVQSAVEALPPKCRKIFSLSRESGLSNAEIASEMGISVKTVEAHITRALKELRVQFKKLYSLILF